MEERIIDDEYGRGIRLKKTKDGYVDATDELTKEQTDGDALLAENGEDELVEEVTFEFPDLTEDDEDLVNLSPEEAIALRKKKEEEAAARAANYARLCAEGEELLASGSYHAAELKFEKALPLDVEAVDAAVGYWRAKTENFQKLDVLGEEYAETGFESLENDLGTGAAERIRAEYGGVFKARLDEIEAEEKPLAESVESKQAKRREILSERLKGARIKFFVTLVPTLVTLLLGIVFGVKIPSRPDGLFVGMTVGAGIAFVGCFIAFAIFTNKLLNSVRINRANENLSSTEDGARLVALRALKELYLNFVD